MTAAGAAEFSTRSHSANGQHIVVSAQGIKKRSRISISTSDASSSSDCSLTPPPTQPNEIMNVVLNPAAPTKMTAVPQVRAQMMVKQSVQLKPTAAAGMQTSFTNSLATPPTCASSAANVQQQAVVKPSQLPSSTSFSFTSSSSFAVQPKSTPAPKKRSKVCIICHQVLKLILFTF